MVGQTSGASALLRGRNRDRRVRGYIQSNRKRVQYPSAYYVLNELNIQVKGASKECN